MTDKTPTKAPAKRRTTKTEVAAPAKFSPIEKTFAMIETAVSRGATPEELMQLMEIRREVQAEFARHAFREAKSALLSDLPVIKKQKVARFNSKGGGMVEYYYASLEDIVETVKPYLKKHGFSFAWQQAVTGNGTISETCTLSHKDGHSESCTMAAMLDQSGGKNPIQMVASTSSYLRRYTLTGVAGIATADQDIDGRLPQNYASETLEGILEGDEDQADLISAMIDEAVSMADLNASGSMIAEFPEGATKEGLKKEWFVKKQDLVKQAMQAEVPDNG